MANTTKYVNTASSPGGDGSTNGTAGATRAYASLNEAEAALPADITTGGNQGIWTIECSGSTADTTAVTFAGTTTSSSYYVKVIGSSVLGTAWDDSKYHITLSGTVSLSCSDIYTQFIKIQIECDTTSAYTDRIINLDGSLISGVIIDKCIIRKKTGGNTAYTGVFIGTYPIGTVISNCAFFGIQEQAIRSRTDSTTEYAKIINCTFLNCTRGVQRDSGSYARISNCVASASTTCFDVNGGSWGTCSNNCSTDATAPGTSSLTSQNLATQIKFTTTTAGSENIALASDSVCVNAGVDASASLLDSVDINGTTRSGTWDIGAYEYASGGGATPLSYNTLTESFEPTDAVGGLRVYRALFGENLEN